MAINDDIESFNAVQRAVDRISKNGRWLDFKLSNGIVLTIKGIPPMLLSAINDSFKLPDPPVIWMEELGRNEPNPNDPNYLKSITDMMERQEDAIQNLILGVGTLVKEVPEGYFRPEEDGWFAQVQYAARVAGVELELHEDDEIKRYLCWLTYYAIENGSDAAIVKGLPMRLTGIREEEVEEVIESFRSVQERGSNNQSPVEAGSQDGNTTNRAGRRSSPRNRRT